MLKAEGADVDKDSRERRTDNVYIERARWLTKYVEDDMRAIAYVYILESTRI